MRTETHIDLIKWDCGKTTDLGIDEVPEWQDFSERDATVDQMRIEEVLLSKNLGGKELLHIGVGNSQFAKNLHSKVKVIDGITIQLGELNKGNECKIENYRVQLLNKFSDKFVTQLNNSYDFIIDNNPTSFSCCRKHFFQMLENYYRCLKPGGIILTDKLGLNWVTTLNDKAWRLTIDDWFKIGEKLNLKMINYTSYVIGLQK